MKDSAVTADEEVKPYRIKEVLKEARQARIERKKGLLPTSITWKKRCSFYIMITYEITLSKQFRKDYAIARCMVLFRKTDERVVLVSYNPFQTPSPYEKLKRRSQYLFKAY